MTRDECETRSSSPSSEPLVTILIEGEGEREGRGERGEGGWGREEMEEREEEMPTITSV